MLCTHTVSSDNDRHPIVAVYTMNVEVESEVMGHTPSIFILYEFIAQCFCNRLLLTTILDWWCATNGVTLGV